MPPNRFKSLFYLGFDGGLRWKTKSYEDVDENGNRILKFRWLLIFPGSNSITKIVWKRQRHKDNSGRSYRERVSYAFADLYNYAAEHVHLLTYRLFHARALFLAFPRWNDRVPAGHPLMFALDNFKQTFDAMYDNHEGALVQKAYFGLSQADCQGDGSDRILNETTFAATLTMRGDENDQSGPIPGEFKQSTNFLVDLGPRFPRYGRKDPYQEIEERMEAVDKEEEDRKDDDDMDDDDEVDENIMDSDDDFDMDMEGLSFHH
ncbi:hypothetical protein F5Y16DRAFT_394740 [Xylariaceae sp. FL0255]|nr:hypothetical protein F5Y16DRAFT_394740 [Xylariaceae sp. FL0255]